MNNRSNPHGAIAISQHESRKLWAYPGDGDLGDIIIYDIDTDEFKSIFAGYTTNSYQLTWLEINLEGTIIAAASTEGKTISVYSLENWELLHTFSRGSIAAHISFLNFQIGWKRLIASSENGTIHIFSLSNDIEEKSGSSNFGILKKWYSYFTHKTSYAKFRLKDPETVSIMPNDESIQVYSTTGNIYFGQIDSQAGEDVVLEDTFNFMEYKLEGN